MSFEHYIRSGNRRLRCGYTTGSCAALAASGAAELLLTGRAPEKLNLLTPGGLRVETAPVFCRMEGDQAACAVQKDAGDDPDVTDGILIVATVGRTAEGITIDGGEGIGKVTRPGLDRAVGEAAINSVPRRMIFAAMETLCDELNYSGGLKVVISAPEGREIAKKTFNPMLGIEGGISILGTSGIVEPMSEQAIVDTIALEIRQKAASGNRRLILCPGNFGLDYLSREMPELEAIPRVKCSNYIGDALDLAILEGMEEVLLIGHVGKLVKLAGGIMNTHSRMADCRRELFCAHAALCGAERMICEKLMQQVTTDGCLEILKNERLCKPVMESLLREIQTVLERKSGGTCRFGAILFSNVYGLLGKTAEAEALLGEWRDAV